MLPDLWSVALGLIWPPCFAVFWRAAFRQRTAIEFWESWFFGALGAIAAGVPGWSLLQIGVAAASAIFAAIMWWLSRRKRKRSAKLAGAKSRALLAAVVARMKETLKPRPVLRPVPGGAA